MPRSAAALATRAVLALLVASAAISLAASRAWALDEGADTARLLSFGGMCPNCELAGRKLPDSRFFGANFSGASFVACDLHGASFFGSSFVGADMSRADLRGASLFGSDFMNANFTDANLSTIQGHGVQLAGANLTRARLDSANLPGSNLTHAVAREAQFISAQLLGANLDDGQFDRASFRGANLFRATLTGGSFVGADFKGANLAFSDLEGVDLSAAKGLTQDQVDLACASAATRLPTGLVGRACKGSRLIIMRSTIAPHAGTPHYVIEPETVTAF